MGQALDFCRECDTQESCCDCADLHEWIMERLENEWISVEDRLPETNEYGSIDAVLVTDGHILHMAYFNGKEWFFCENGEMKEPMFYCVTHWMPLPEPPKEDKHEKI